MSPYEHPLKGKRTFFRAIFLALYSLLSIFVGIILMLIFRRHNKAIRRAWAKSMLFVIGVKVVMHGKLEPANIYILNHRSLLDVILFEYIFENDVAWVAKKELADIPFFGLMLKIPNMINIDRRDKHSLRKLLKESKEAFKKGRSIAIFPEGTRSLRQEIRHFQNGAKIVASIHNSTVQPILIIGSRERLDTTNLIHSSGEVHIHFFEVIHPPFKDGWYENIEQKMRKTSASLTHTR